MMSRPQALRPGDPAPRFQAPIGGHPVFHFDQAAGRYVVLSFFGSLQNPDIRKSADHIVGRHRQWFNDENACFFGVSIDPADEQNGLLRDAATGIRYFRDFDRKVSELYGVLVPKPDGGLAYAAVTLVLDRMLRVVAVLPIGPGHDEMFDRVIANLAASAGTAPAAPVLILPRIFEPEFCTHLITAFSAGGSRAGGVAEDLAGKVVEVQDSELKRRRDFYISENDLKQEIAHRLTRRLLPVIQQAFQFSVTYIERYLLACYEAENGGFFAAHRDVGEAKGTAHRRFAVTINLNSEYDGGDLMFPEFGHATYRAPPGGAVVFSCSLLHLVTPVQRGKRFAFLPFLHDNAAEAVREKNQAFQSSQVVHRN
jgi:predicted 2-oxoglutarate/Fe(II)-dependent dioxygenase YbiX/peroxiredoxin